jgi:hypothetical protein
MPQRIGGIIMPLQIGDKVQYSAKFLRSISCYTGELPFAQGEITELTGKVGEEYRIATIRWINAFAPDKVNVANLVKIGEIEHD